MSLEIDLPDRVFIFVVACGRRADGQVNIPDRFVHDIHKAEDILVLFPERALTKSAMDIEIWLQSALVSTLLLDVANDVDAIFVTSAAMVFIFATVVDQMKQFLGRE